MNAIEKLRAIVRATEGKDELDQSHGLAVGDCAELLQEIDSMRAALKSIAERKCRGGWGGACGEADCSASEAEYALERSP